VGRALELEESHILIAHTKTHSYVPSWMRSASCPCDAFDARVLHLAAQTPSATPIETSYRATRALGRSHAPAPRSRPPPATRARLLALAHWPGLDRWQVSHIVKIAALLLLLESIKSNGGLWWKRRWGWVAVKHHTPSRARERDEQERREEERGGACASEATANKTLLQYHSEPMVFLTHQARYYFIVARWRALFELSHCSTASSSPSSCPTTDTYSHRALLSLRFAAPNAIPHNDTTSTCTILEFAGHVHFSPCVSRSKQASNVVRVRRCEAVCQLLTLLLARYTSSCSLQVD